MLLSQNGNCPSEKVLYSFKTDQGGTSRQERNTHSHKQRTTTVRFQRQLLLVARSKVAQAAALAVCLDVRPLSFCDDKSGMHHLAHSVFEMGQYELENETIDPKSDLPGRTAVTNALKDLGYKHRQYFASELRNGSLQYSAPITIDGVHLKVQVKHFYDFVLHFIEVSVNGPFQEPTFKIRKITLLIVEGPDSPTAQNIKSCLNNALMEKYELSMDHFFCDFTIVTDGAAVMARVANVSVSREIHAPDEI